MPGTVKSHLLIDKYKEIVIERYSEPMKEEILGSFLSLPPVVRQEPAQGRREAAKLVTKKKSKEKQAKQTTVSESRREKCKRATR